jgi:hypothetical protein
MPHETSQVWQKVFQELRTKGVGKSEIAQMLCIQEAELETLVFGLVMTYVPGNLTAPPTPRRNPDLRRI